MTIMLIFTKLRLWLYGKTGRIGWPTWSFQQVHGSESISELSEWTFQAMPDGLVIRCKAWATGEAATMSSASEFGRIVNSDSGEVLVQMFGPPRAAGREDLGSDPCFRVYSAQVA